MGVDENPETGQGPAGGSMGQEGPGSAGGSWDGSVHTQGQGRGIFQLAQKYFIVSAARVPFPS